MCLTRGLLQKVRKILEEASNPAELHQLVNAGVLGVSQHVAQLAERGINGAVPIPQLSGLI